MEGENGLFAPQYGLILCLLPLVSSAYAIIECFNQCFPKEAAEILDELWKARVPEGLREYALQEKEEYTIGSYLLPVKSLSCWNWETLRDMLLKREGTTVERILDYIEYKKSGSDKLYIAPEQRAEAKARGMKFWRDDDDI